MTVKMILSNLRPGADVSIIEPNNSLVLSLSQTKHQENALGWLLIEIGGKCFLFSFGATHNENLEVEAWAFLTPLTKEILIDLDEEFREKLIKLNLNKLKQKISCKIVTAYLEPGTYIFVEPGGSLSLSTSSTQDMKNPSSWTLIEIGEKYFCLSLWIIREYLCEGLEVKSGAFLNPVTRDNLVGLVEECKKREGYCCHNEDKANWALRRFRIANLLKEKYP